MRAQVSPGANQALDLSPCTRLTWLRFACAPSVPAPHLPSLLSCLLGVVPVRRAALWTGWCLPTHALPRTSSSLAQLQGPQSGAQPPRLCS